MEQGLRNTAQRIVNAENGFIALLMRVAEIDKSKAEHVFQIYRQLKVLKLDCVGGSYTVKHGALLDVDVILCAVDTPLKKSRR